MPTQVDAAWQVANLPPGGLTSVMGVNPDAGPYTGSPIQCDQSTGLLVLSGPLLQLAAASLTQAGAIGTGGGQQLQGPFLLSGQFGSGPPPPFTGGGWSVISQDGGIAFYETTEGAISSPNASLVWQGFPLSNVFTLAVNGELQLNGGSVGGNDVWLQNTGSGAYLRFPGTGLSPGSAAAILSVDQTIALDALDITAYLGLDGFGNPTTFALSGILPYFSVNGELGVYGSLIDGTPVTGGVITGPGSGSLDWSVVTGTPTTVAGYGISDTVSPVVLTSPSSGDVLSFDGSDWVNLPGGGTPTQLTQAGGFVSVGVSGEILSEPAPGQTLTARNYTDTASLAINDAGELSLYAGGDRMLYGDSAGNIQLGNSFATLQLPNTGGWLLDAGTGYSFGCDGSGNVSLLPTGAGAFGVFGATPVPQQMGSGANVGWDMGSSGQFVQVDDTWDGGVGGNRYSISDLIVAGKNYGWLAP